jgi:hypothetical protein
VGGERLNLECTSTGFFSHPDDYYLRWPKQATPAEMFGTYFLKSLTPREEISGFLIQSASCLRDNGCQREAVEAACYSHDLAPHHRLHLETLDHLIRPWYAKLQEQLPPPRPAVDIHWPSQRFPNLPMTFKREIVCLTVLDHLAKNPKWQATYRQPIRRSSTTGLPFGLPEKMVVKCDEEWNIQPLPNP